jgi:2-keto-3-deoxy-L-rhamnonate aldolase RhmA
MAASDDQTETLASATTDDLTAAAHQSPDPEPGSGSGPSDLVTAVREAARSRRPAKRRGFWVSYLSPYALEAALTPGVAWVGLDLQHGDIDAGDVAGLLRVTERRGVPVLARMPGHDTAAIARVVDAGVHGVIVPSVESPEAAAALVRAVRLPPHGARSTGMARSSLGVVSAGEPLLLPMVETRSGRDHAAAIAAVEGVDGIFVGPYDLSMSLGIGSPSSPEGLSAVRSVLDVGRAAGRIVGLYTGSDELRSLAPLTDLVAVDSDVTALRLGMGALFG